MTSVPTARIIQNNPSSKLQIHKLLEETVRHRAIQHIHFLGLLYQVFSLILDSQVSSENVLSSSKKRCNVFLLLVPTLLDILSGIFIQEGF